MRLRGRRLTMVLTIVLLVVVGGGASAAWALGKTRPAMPEGYTAGPTDDSVVQLSVTAGEHSRAGEVQQTVQRYFDSINRRDFQAWQTVVGADQSANQTEDGWVTAYSTTVDSNLVVAAIADDPLRVRMMFTSEQAPEFAPRRLPAPCINWDLTYLLAEQDGGLVLSGIEPSKQSMTACEQPSK